MIHLCSLISNLPSPLPAEPAASSACKTKSKRKIRLFRSCIVSFNHMIVHNSIKPDSGTGHMFYCSVMHGLEVPNNNYSAHFFSTISFQNA